MTAIIDRRPQTTMSGDEVSLRTTFSAPSTSLSEGDVYFALPAWAPTPHLIAPQPRLRPSLFDPVARLAVMMFNACLRRRPVTFCKDSLMVFNP